jgi:hypothetical protein
MLATHCEQEVRALQTCMEEKGRLPSRLGTSEVQMQRTGTDAGSSSSASPSSLSLPSTDPSLFGRVPVECSALASAMDTCLTAATVE